jgi:hypothetical protein
MVPPAEEVAAGVLAQAAAGVAAVRAAAAA